MSFDFQLRNRRHRSARPGAQGCAALSVDTPGRKPVVLTFINTGATAGLRCAHVRYQHTWILDAADVQQVLKLFFFSSE